MLKWDGRPIDVTAPSRARHPRIKAHRAETIERIIVKRIPVTPKLRTVADLAKVADDATVKRALRQAKFSTPELAQLPKRLQAFSAAPTRSPGEDIMLDLVVDAGLEHPEVNAPYRLPPGRLPRPPLAGAALDRRGRQRRMARRPARQARDAQRQAELEAQGERVIRVSHAKRTVSRNAPSPA